MPKTYYTDTMTQTGVKIIVYGKPGVGKTPLIATAPTPYIFSAENGLLSLRRQRVPFARIDCWKDLLECKNWLLSSTEARKYATYGFDSVSEIAEVLLQEALAKNKDGRAAYGDMQTEIAKLLREVRNMHGPNIVFNFKEEYYVDGALNTAVFMPTVPGKNLKMDLAYLTDEVFHMHTITGQDGKSYSALRTQSDWRTVAKDRSGALDVIERPDLTFIFNKINGAV